MVEVVDDFFVDDLLERGNGEDFAGDGAGRAGEGDFEFVVVAVAVGVGAAAEGVPVFFFGEGWGIEAVGGGEFEAQGKVDHGGVLLVDGRKRGRGWRWRSWMDSTEWGRVRER